MSKPSFEVTSGFLLKLIKFSALHIKSDADVVQAFETLNQNKQTVLTATDVEPLEQSFKSSVPENLKDLASAIESMLDK